MSERIKAPEAAKVRARLVIRKRYKALGEGKRVDSPHILAGRLVAYAEATAKAYPIEPSPAYREYVESHFHTKFIELCKIAPIKAERR